MSDRALPSWLLAGAGLVVIVAGMQAAASLLVPFLLSAFVAFICLPPMQALIRRGVPAGAAVLAVTVGLLAIGFLITAFVGASIVDFSHNLPLYEANLKGQIAGFAAWLSHLGIVVSKETLTGYLNPAAAMGMIGRLVSGLGNALANTFMIVLTVIFLLLEAAALPNKWRLLGRQAPSSDGFQRFLDSVNRYLRVKTVVSLATGAAVALVLALMGVDYPLLWGLVAFLFNYVPSIGSIIAAVPALLLAQVQIGWHATLGAGIGYLVINLVMGNVVEPRLMSSSVGLSALVVFLSLVFWGWVLGPVGMLLSVPLTMIVKLALEARDDTRWIAVLLGSDASPPAEEEAEA